LIFKGELDVDYHQLQPLTPAEREEIFKRGTGGFSGSHTRWHERAKTPMTDEELIEALKYEIGIEGGSGGPDKMWVHYRGNGLKIWGHWEYQNPCSDKPLFAGASTVAMARTVYGIKTPEQWREPSLLDLMNQ
jgi:hypothetical protein